MKNVAGSSRKNHDFTSYSNNINVYSVCKNDYISTKNDIYNNLKKLMKVFKIFYINTVIANIHSSPTCHVKKFYRNPQFFISACEFFVFYSCNKLVLFVNMFHFKLYLWDYIQKWAKRCALWTTETFFFSFEE